MPTADNWMNSRWLPSVFRVFLNNMVMVDEPAHGQLRTLVHSAFTPRMIEQLAVPANQLKWRGTIGLRGPEALPVRIV